MTTVMRLTVRSLRTKKASPPPTAMPALVPLMLAAASMPSSRRLVQLVVNWSYYWNKGSQDWQREDSDIDDGYADKADSYVTIGVGTSGYIKGYGVMAGVDAPVFGAVMFAVGYSSTEDAQVEDGDKKAEANRWGATLGYTYSLSKRTNVYGVMAYYQDKVDNEYNEATEK